MIFFVRNLFSLKTKKVADKVNELSFINDSRILKKPPHNLLIQVTERDPIAYSTQSWGIAYLDDNCLVFSRPGKVPKGLPEVIGLTIPSKMNGNPLAGKQASIIQSALTVFASHPDLTLKSLSIDKHGWLEAQLNTAIILRLGSIDELDKKISLAQKVIASIQSEQPEKTIEYIDISAIDAPVWKPKEAGKAKRIKSEDE